MKSILPLFLCFFVIGSTVPTISDWKKIKTKPDHVGIDEELAGYRRIYSIIASTHGIKFKQPVTMGFSSIKMKKGKGTVIGLCTYGKNFREIDIDLEYWNSATQKSRRTLIYHEMTHCLCSRYHTWKNGTYPEADSDLDLIVEHGSKEFKNNPPGFLPDKCPASIMYPYIVSDECVDKHWRMYENEMFDGCKPY